MRLADGPRPQQRRGLTQRGARPWCANILTEAVREEAGLRRGDAPEPVDMPIDAVCARLAAGDAVKLYGFGSPSICTTGADGLGAIPAPGRRRG